MFGKVKPTTRKGAASLMNNNEAVSPVIGVILMVAVTVILAAIVAAFFFGMVNNMPTAPQVSYFSVERSADEQITISNTAPIAIELQDIEIWIDDGTGTGAAKLAESACVPAIVAPDTISGTLQAGTDVVADVGTADPVKVTLKARVNGASMQVIQTTIC